MCVSFALYGEFVLPRSHFRWNDAVRGSFALAQVDLSFEPGSESCVFFARARAFDLCPMLDLGPVHGRELRHFLDLFRRRDANGGGLPRRGRGVRVH